MDAYKNICNIFITTVLNNSTAHTFNGIQFKSNRENAAVRRCISQKPSKRFLRNFAGVINILI